jgi:hypothetical protein
MATNVSTKRVQSVRSLDGFSISKQKNGAKKVYAARPRTSKLITLSGQDEVSRVTSRSPMITRFSDKLMKPDDMQRAIDETAKVAASKLAPPVTRTVKPVENVSTVSSPTQRKESMLIAALNGAPNDLKRFDEKVEKFSKSHKRAINVVFVSGCLVVISGLLGYLNITKASIKLASSRAGISATLPEYSAGYSPTGNVTYAPGQVAVNFQSSVLGDSFNLTQRKTLWDSQSLLANYILPLTPLYETYRDRGLTVYVWGKGHAAWVDHGILYEITNDNNLSIEQILKIATSM